MNPKELDTLSFHDLRPVAVERGIDPTLYETKAELLEAIQPAAAEKPLFVSASSFFGNDVRPDYLIKNLIELNSDWLLVGPSGEGKTFVAVDVVVSVGVGGQTFNGLHCRQGAVLYLAGEGHTGIKRRIRALAKKRGLSADDVKHIYVSNSAIDFSNGSLRAAVAAMKALEVKYGIVFLFIVIDTLHRHMIGEENSAKDTGEYIRSVQYLRESFPGASTCTIHHSGHSESTLGRGRGSSAIPAAMDAIVLCSKGLLTVTKLKDGAIPEPIEFKVVPIEIGTDDDGEPITSCTVEYGQRSVKHRSPSLAGQEKIIVRLLDETVAKSELIGDLRKRFNDYRRNLDPEVKANTLKNAYLKAIPSLIEKQVIRQNDNLISLISCEPSPSLYRHFPSENDAFIETSPSLSSPHPIRVEKNDAVTDEVAILSEEDFEGIF